MSTPITIRGRKARKGERMTGGGGWQLAATRGSTRVFRATLLGTFNLGRKRVAVFNVPK
jgi:hypothetical protein